MKQWTYDNRCRYLAEAFLEDEPKPASEQDIVELAQLIQNTIEDWLVFDFRRREAAS